MANVSCPFSPCPSLWQASGLEIRRFRANSKTTRISRTVVAASPLGRPCLNYGLGGCVKVLTCQQTMSYSGHGMDRPDVVTMTMCYRCNLSRKRKYGGYIQLLYKIQGSGSLYTPITLALA